MNSFTSNELNSFTHLCKIKTQYTKYTLEFFENFQIFFDLHNNVQWIVNSYNSLEKITIQKFLLKDIKKITSFLKKVFFYKSQGKNIPRFPIQNLRQIS